MYGKAHVGNHLSDVSYPNFLKQGDTLSLFFNAALERVIRKVQEK
jgi:hypothetical protein